MQEISRLTVSVCTHKPEASTLKSNCLLSHSRYSRTRESQSLSATTTATQNNKDKLQNYSNPPRWNSWIFFMTFLEQKGPLCRKVKSWIINLFAYRSILWKFLYRKSLKIRDKMEVWWVEVNFSKSIILRKSDLKFQYTKLKAQNIWTLIIFSTKIDTKVIWIDDSLSLGLLQSIFYET